MIYNLKNDLEKLFSENFKDQGKGYLDVDKILKNTAILTDFYISYLQIDKAWKLNNEYFNCLLSTATDKDKYKDYKIDWNIENVKPFFEEFNVKRFWFKNSLDIRNPYASITTKENEIIAFQDGVNTIFYTGEYLEGGQMFKEGITKNNNTPTSNEIEEGFFQTQKPKQSNNEDSDSYFDDFIYAYFPKKFLLSPFSRNFYTLTQGKNLLRNREEPIIRYYFNFIPKGIDDCTTPEKYLSCINDFKTKFTSFIEQLEKYLNDRNIPFQTKIPTSLENFGRGDNFVLYVSQNHYYYLQELIEILYEKYKSILGKKLPLFTNRLKEKDGISIAEDPLKSGESFGSDKSKLIYNTIKKLAIDDKKNDITVDDIITELKNQGFEQGDLFRNPNSNYTYNTSSFESQTDFKFNPLGVNYHLYVYGRVALDYALELVERAVWLNSNTITWLTYDVKPESKEGFYRLVKPDEIEIIYWFLSQIFKFGWMRKYFPTNLVTIISSKEKSNQTDNATYLNNIKLKYQAAFHNYTDILKDAEAFKTNSLMPLKFFYNVKQFFTSEVNDIGLEIEEYWKTLFSVPEKSVISKIYEIPKGSLGVNKDVIKQGRKIYYQYVKPLYPIPNKDNNYEFCPTEKGKLQIAMVMLSIYCPSLFK